MTTASNCLPREMNCSSRLLSNKKIFIAIIVLAMIPLYAYQRSFLNTLSTSTFTGHSWISGSSYTTPNDTQLIVESIDKEDELDLDPFKYLPPEEEIRKSENRHRQLMKFVAEEKEYMKKMTKLTQSEVEISRSKCKLKKDFISKKCAHIEQKAWLNVMGVQTFFILTECSDSLMVGKPWVIFLHGMKYSSQTWIDLNYLRMVAKLGFNTMAIDLPGYGKSDKGEISDKAGFLEQIIEHFGLTKYVIVSPSMSGEYAIELLKRKNKAFVGLVAVAPVNTNTIGAIVAKEIQTQCFSIVGENDDTRFAKESTENLSKLANHRVYEIKDAKHACYLQQPDIFLKELNQFLLCDLKY